MNLYLSSKKPWKETIYDGFSVHFVGSCNKWSEIFSLLKVKDFNAVTDLLNQENGCYGFIIQSEEFIFASVDHICSTPIYYSDNSISNCVYELQKNANLSEVNRLAVKEFCMTGYCTGNQSLYEGLFMLQAGQSIFIAANSTRNIRDNPKIIQNYSYLPDIDKSPNIEHTKSKLSSVIDSIFKELVAQLDGRAVLLPLSGGLDSRLVLTKLLEHGHNNIISFSYGSKGNGEAVIAKKIAEKLGVKWLDIPSENPKALYESDICKDFENFVDGLSIVPSYLDFEALYMLSQRDDIPKDGVIINGQTGDFIAGAHIPKTLLNNNANIDDVIEEIAKIHYRQRLDILADKSVIRASIENYNGYPPPALFEFWEWKERQAKAVMVGQRSYDFFGYDWLLPLWDKRLVDYFATVPYELKSERKLMVEYLKDYDFKGVFTDNYPEITPWPKGRSWIKFISRIFGVIAGAKAKESCYARLYYFSNYHNQFALFGYKKYLSRYKKTQRFVGQAAMQWLEERGIKAP